jgi:hypothetical protein
MWIYDDSHRPIICQSGLLKENYSNNRRVKWTSDLFHLDEEMTPLDLKKKCCFVELLLKKLHNIA